MEGNNYVHLSLREYDEMRSKISSLEKQVHDLTKSGEYFDVSVQVSRTRIGQYTPTILCGISKDSAITILMEELNQSREAFNKVDRELTVLKMKKGKWISI